MHMSLPKRTSNTAILLIGILLIAANLRGPFTGLPPLVELIRADLNLTAASASILITLPLLAFALISPGSATVARKHGLERTLFGALIMITLGIVLRSTGTVQALYAGTGLIGIGIATGNVLLPSLVKRDFPHNIVVMTSAYALVMGIAAALCSSIAIPLANTWGWRGSLASFAMLPILAMIFWIMQLGKQTSPPENASVATHESKVWHSRLAWQVTLFLGLNSTIYYIVISWLPSILVDSGLSMKQAGSLHGVLQLATAVPSMILVPILRKISDQRLIAVGFTILSTIALLGLLVAPQHAFVWSSLFGIGTGAGIILGLSFVGLREKLPKKPQHYQECRSLSAIFSPPLGQFPSAFYMISLRAGTCRCSPA